ncbi:MAG: amino acid adenylation domain-containing protein, partial [Pseudomonadota bacterium]|nr:amino acid adenylation domain-containing protein [Pseudomonadota bacterium]
MTLLAGWSALLSRLSGQDEVVVGVPVANRQRREVEPLLGFFVNTLAIRTTVPDVATVTELLAAVKEGMLEAQAHQALPFEQVVEALNPPRSMGHSPVFQALLSMNNTPDIGELSLPGLRLSAVAQEYRTTHFDLSLSLMDEGETIRGQLDYASDLFDAATMSRWVGYWVGLLDGMTNSPTQAVARLPLMDPTERLRVLEDFNATDVAYPAGLIHALFEARAAADPSAEALVYEDCRLSYGELNVRANRLAHHLIRRGIRPDDRVAICVERGIAMVVAVLAVLKAGGAYVPLDPVYPEDRLRYMLQDSTPVAVLTEATWCERLQVDAAAAVLMDDETAYASLPSTNPDPVALGLKPEHLAYVIYTSGSTGQPKGVMVEHRSAVNFWKAMSCTTHAGCVAGSNIALNASFNFDMSLKGLLQLLSGHCIFIIPQEDRYTGASLIGFIEKHRIDAIDCTPTQLKWLLEAGLLGGETLTLHTVLIGGEAIDAMTWRKLADFPAITFFNMYGPTECTVDATIGRVDGQSPHIGRPILNACIRILDKGGELVPVGIVGEIYIGGAGVARGYLNRPQLTVERFITDPFGAPGARLYRTGDLGRWLADGTIEYIGRNDFQVKIRGFRIELGEIEARLVGCAQVREAVVLAREVGVDDQRLVAYLTMIDGAVVDAAVLRETLSRQLPDYMLPSAYVQLERLPLTPNGKLDRDALPAPDTTALAVRGYEAPEGPVEQAIAHIWQELLGVERVGRHDNFFELGGHSLLAVLVVSRLRQVLGVEVALRELFAQPTLAFLAIQVEDAQATTLSALHPAGRDDPLPLSWAQQRLWVLDQLDAAAGAAYHMPVALRLEGQLDKVALRTALDGVVARHEVLRTRFIREAWQAEPVQVIDGPTRGWPLRERSVAGLPAPEQVATLSRWSAEEATAPFDLAAGPLVRGQLVELTEQEHVLLLTQHHIVSDGWSIGILVQEVCALYAAALTGQADGLPALAVQYADYAVWQRGWLKDAVLLEQVTYWKQALTGAPAVLTLPMDRPRPTQQSYAGGQVPLRLDAALTQRLRVLSRTQGTTLFMT